MTPASAAAQPLSQATESVYEPPATVGGSSAFQLMAGALALWMLAQPARHWSPSAAAGAATDDGESVAQPPQARGTPLNSEPHWTESHSAAQSA